MRIRVLVLTVAAVLLVGLTGAAVVAAHPGRSSSSPHAVMMGGSTSEAVWLSQMVAHHEEAVASAAELARSPREEMRAFGRAIVRTQSAQVVEMQGWLDRWYPDQPADTAYRPMMRDLAGLQGDDLDIAFLEDMVGHHMVAVMVSQRLLVAGAEHTAVAALATTIRDDQRAEIVQMRRWLDAWFDEGASMMRRW